MSREILFRAKAINRDSIDGRCRRTDYKNGDWIYGLITKPYNEEYDFPAEMRNTDGVAGIEVDYKTIGQFTGQYDANKKKIYEARLFSMTAIMTELTDSQGRFQRKLLCFGTKITADLYARL